MCGLIVCENENIEVRKTLLQKRGPDAVAIVKTEEEAFIFNRLSIMDPGESGMQPFKINDHILVCNGEIYNEMVLKKEITDYEFKSGSDCEVLLPLYLKFGTQFFSMLDAEFAIVLKDPIKGLIAGRDPIGIRPLFYGVTQSGKILFASEVKGLIGLCDKIVPFPPGHYYESGVFKRYTDLIEDRKPKHFDRSLISKEIELRLTNAVLKRLTSDAPIGFLLSGGLDSSLVCAIAQKAFNKPIRTFAIGMTDDPIDLKYAKIVSDYIGSNHTEVLMTKQEVIGCLNELIYNLETYDITTIRASIGMFILSRYIKKHTDIKVLLTGEVSDELFGYKYTDFAPDAESFQQESIKRMKELHQYDVLRADRCLASNSLEARVPFADIAFVDYVMQIDPKLKMNTYQMGKFLLRDAFKHTGLLPDQILYRDKAAFSDAVGHSMVDHLKAFADEKYSDDEFLRKRPIYPNLEPFTKEALLYMELFESHFPNHQHLIPGYWMPNKNWSNCQVNDPSARVLSNYGKSGE